MTRSRILRLLGWTAIAVWAWRAGTGALRRHSLAEPGPASGVSGLASTHVPGVSGLASTQSGGETATVTPLRPGKDPLEDLISEQEAAAAAEAGSIGGPHSNNVELDPADHDPAMDAVLEAGGGYAEGYDIAEADLQENASHGDGHAEPTSDAFAPEAESDRSTAEYADVDGQDEG
jgi:hypothetical protein